MSMRIFGAFFVFAACGTFGFLLAAAYRKEQRELAQFARALDSMICELEYRLTPLPQLCRNAAELLSGGSRSVFLTLAQELENQISPNAVCCMHAAMSHVRDLPRNVRHMLELLGTSLGSFDLDGQIKQFHNIRQECMSVWSEMNLNGKEQIRKYQTLGLCAGAALAILLL